MSTYLPTIKQLQYLVALHEHGHFGKAADASFVSQSTLSAGIRELESLLGVTLVERSRRVVRFTALGEQVVAKANRLLREAEARLLAHHAVIPLYFYTSRHLVRPEVDGFEANPLDRHPSRFLRLRAEAP